MQEKEIKYTENGIPMTTEPYDFHLEKSFIDAVKNLQDQNDKLSEDFVESIQTEIDKMSGRLAEPDKLSQEEVDEMMEILASGKPIITEEILETIQRMVALPGITTIHYTMSGHDKKPFRGKMTCYLMRSADGEEVQIPKIARRPHGDKTMIMPFTEKRKLFHLADNFAKGPEDKRWTDIVTRFSAAYTVLDRIVQGMQEEKILLPEDATPVRIERIDKVLHGKGNPKAKEAEVIPGRTQATEMEDPKDKGTIIKKN